MATKLVGSNDWRKDRIQAIYKAMGLNEKITRVSELRKALRTDNSGQYLIPEDLEPMIRGTLLQLSPLTALVQNVTAASNIHQFRRRTAVNAGRHEGEMPTPTYGQSTYDPRQVAIKILRNYGQVSDFQQTASKKFADSVAEETMASIEGLVDLVEFSTIWGVSNEFTSAQGGYFTGDAYMYPGWYQWLLRDAATATNIIDPDATITLAHLDSALAGSRRAFKQTQRDPYVWLMSESMENKIAGLQTRIQRQAPSLEFEGGFVMSTYKGIPILISSFTEPETTSTSPTLSGGATGVGSGGTIADGSYCYKIASITLTGEQVVGARNAVLTLSGGNDNSVNLAWTDDATAKLYAIYRAASDTNEDDNYSLIDIINAVTYTDDKPSGRRITYTDAGARSPKTSVHPLGTGEQVIALVNLSEERGISRPVLNPSLGDPIDALVNYVEVVENTASYQWALQSYHALQCGFGQTQAIIRRATTT